MLDEFKNLLTLIRQFDKKIDNVKLARRSDNDKIYLPILSDAERCNYSGIVLAGGSHPP